MRCTTTIEQKANKILEDYLSAIPSSNDKYEEYTENNFTILEMSENEIFNRLKTIDWSFTDADTTYLSHDIHPYPAKFIPQIPETIIKLLTYPGETVWDPFGGSGTTALESLTNNRGCISSDINPIAKIIGESKTATLTFLEELELQSLIERIKLFINSENIMQYLAGHADVIKTYIPDIPNIGKWFCKEAVAELALVKHIIKNNVKSDAVLNIANSSLSKAVNKVSNQEAETRYCAKVKYLLYGETINCFYEALCSNATKIKAIGKLLGFRRATFLTENVMDDIVGKDKPISNNQIDLIVTSPPYPNAFDYHLYHRFRIFWLDFDPRTMAKKEIGSHLKYQKQKLGFDSFRDEMHKALVNFYSALKPGRFAVLVLGDAIFEGVLYNTAKEIGEVAQTVGFNFIGIVTRPLHETKRSMQNGVRRAKQEQLLIIRKPNFLLDAILVPAPYKLWEYEKKISNKEVDAVSSNMTFEKKISASNIRYLRELTFHSGIKINSETNIPTWQSLIENGDAFTQATRKDPKYITHGIHEYKGKFYPQLVKPLINISKIENASCVFDPFSGSGTVALEAVINGHKAYGCDINPLAVDISKAKSEILFVNSYDLEHQIGLFNDRINKNRISDVYTDQFDSDSLDEIERWFPKPVIKKIAHILHQINEVPNSTVQNFLAVILSSIIRKISQQEPTDLRIRRRAELLEDAQVFELYSEALSVQIKKIVKFSSVRQFAPHKLIHPTLWEGSCCSAVSVEKNLAPNSIDLIITSPPYATAMPYIDTNRLSLLILKGLNANHRIPIETEMTGTREISKQKRMAIEELIDNKNYGAIRSPQAVSLIEKIHNENKAADIGFRRKNMASLLHMYFNDMSKAFYNMNYVLKSKGKVFIIIGDTKTTTGKGLVIIKTTHILEEIGAMQGWLLTDKIPINVTTENYKHIGNAITENTILCFEKP